MGQNVSVDADPAALKVIIGNSEPKPSRTPASLGSTGWGSGGAQHRVLVWRFERRGRAVTDSPVRLVDSRGLLRYEHITRKDCSFLVLHIVSAGASAAALEPSLALAAALRQLASRAGGVFTPRGLDGPCAGHSCGSASARSPKASSRSPLLHSLFVWSGVEADQRVKARALAKAFELDRVLSNSSVLHQHASPENVSGGAATLVQTSDSSDGAAQAAAEAVQRSRNRLLASLLGRSIELSERTRPPIGAITRGSSDGDAADLSTASGRQQKRVRFPRVGESVRRSLGLGPQSLAAPLPTSGTPVQPPFAQQLAPPAPAAPAAAARAAAGDLAAGPPIGEGEDEDDDDESEDDASSDEDDDGAYDGAGAGNNSFQRPVSAGVGASRVPVVPKLKLQLGTGLSLVGDAGKGVPGTSGGAAPQSARAVLQPRPTGVSGVAANVGANANNVPALSGIGAAVGGGAAAAGGMTKRGAAEAFVPKVSPPSLKLGATVGGHSDPPRASLNLEEINTLEDQLPDHLHKRLQLERCRQECSEALPGALYISGRHVAGNLEILQRHRISHIVNMAADVCDNSFPEHFTYTTYYLKDANYEDISLLFYRTLEIIQDVIDNGGRVLVHCHEGVSRSSTMVIAYLMWRFGIPFETAHERLRLARPICNPNTGFTCQLLSLGKKLRVSGSGTPQSNAARNAVSEKAILFRVAPHHPKEPFLLLKATELSPSGAAGASRSVVLDPRFGWAALHGQQIVFWAGPRTPDAEAAQAAVNNYVRWAEAFEHNRLTLSIASESADPARLWQLLSASGVQVDGAVAVDPALDADYEILVSALRACERSGGDRHASSRADNAQWGDTCGAALTTAVEPPPPRRYPLATACS
eukprot:TRINITY_DN5709_c2_g1_i1.p1 TRINITY_DN5709_c2_g1~~TRINITY_DN5709_c2_g1_i1.p1  ORF type:complete len:870 (-),score=133.94 TRINITY_DN5709_c2_g1_i1:193-2802(-)